MDRHVSTTGYVVASPDIVAEEFEGEFVVLDLKSGTYYSMNAAASALWRAIVAGVPMQALADAVQDAPGVTGQSIYDYAEKLVGYGCLARSDTVGTAALDPATVEALKVSASPPTVEAFSDLADLIMADPIHDVEETVGWPVRKLVAAE
jgi:hypothetical protein